MTKRKRYMGYVCCACLLFCVQCHKKFDEPPVYRGPDIHPNLGIRELRNRHTPGNFEYLTEDSVIEGIVVADDSRDNFYKSVVIQDSTGGITIRLDGFGLFTDYPVGRRLAVKLKGLWMGDYAGMLQLGAGVDRSVPAYPEIRPIPVPLFNRFLVKKELNQPVVPKQVRLDELADSLQSCLVRIDQLEFAVNDTGKTYADPVNRISSNLTVKACGGGSAYVRTSGFARFASARVPRGNGSITAVYSVFRYDKQLLIRDTSDVQVNGLRCRPPGIKELLVEDFEQQANGAVGDHGWKTIAESGDQLFLISHTQGNRYAEISAFATGKPVLVSWLISPPVSLSNSANEILRFVTKDGYDNGATLQVLVSGNYDGANAPWKARWTPLKALMAKGSVVSINPGWVSSGDISLAAFSGTVHIAFRYEGADPISVFDRRTTRFQLDEVRVLGN